MIIFKMYMSFERFKNREACQNEGDEQTLLWMYDDYMSDLDQKYGKVYYLIWESTLNESEQLQLADDRLRASIAKLRQLYRISRDMDTENFNATHKIRHELRLKQIEEILIEDQRDELMGRDL